MADTSEVDKIRDLKAKIEYAKIELCRWQRAAKVARKGSLELADSNDRLILVDAMILEAGFQKLKDQAETALSLIIKAYETEYFDLTGSHYGK